MTDGPAPMCMSCRHFDRITIDPATGTGSPRCAAFPDGIPSSIFWDGRIDHRRPFAGDRGIRFEQDPNRPEFNFDAFTETRGPAPIRIRRSG